MHNHLNSQDVDGYTNATELAPALLLDWGWGVLHMIPPTSIISFCEQMQSWYFLLKYKCTLS
jgi:hypothetical protein